MPLPSRDSLPQPRCHPPVAHRPTESALGGSDRARWGPQPQVGHCHRQRRAERRGVGWHRSQPLPRGVPRTRGPPDSAGTHRGRASFRACRSWGRTSTVLPPCPGPQPHHHHRGALCHHRLRPQPPGVGSQPVPIRPPPASCDAAFAATRDVPWAEGDRGLLPRGRSGRGVRRTKSWPSCAPQLGLEQKRP